MFPCFVWGKGGSFFQIDLPGKKNRGAIALDGGGKLTKGGAGKESDPPLTSRGIPLIFQEREEEKGKEASLATLIEKNTEQREDHVIQPILREKKTEVHILVPHTPKRKRGSDPIFQRRKEKTKRRKRFPLSAGGGK